MDALVEQLKNTGILRTPRIEAAFRAVDRKDFVPAEYENEAYYDEPLPIGHEQTISQPYTVALMLEMLAPNEGERILDVGSGSGWTTALLAHTAGGNGAVFGVERVSALATLGQKNIGKYSFENASIHKAGKEIGLPQEAPFDRILVSAEADSVPEELVEQLRIGGVLVIPVRGTMLCVRRVSETEHEIEQKMRGFAFVPLVTS